MKQNTKGLTWAILSISMLTVMAGAAMAPALGAIRQHFANCNPMLVQLIVSLPALFIILTTLLFRTLCKLMRTRTLALAGLGLYVVAGAGAFFIDDIALLLVLRALLGISVGMIMPLSTGLLSYYFAPEEQGRLMGLSAAMNQMGGVVATLLAGVLATVQWNYAFLVYLLGLIAAVLVAVLLPNDRLVQDGGTLQLRTLLRFHPSVTAMFLVMLLFFIYPTNFALTAHDAGVQPIAATIIMVGLDVVAFCVGLIFGWLMHNMRREMKYIAPLFFMCGYATLAWWNSIGGMVVGSILLGLANGAGVPYVNTIASIKGGKQAAVTVMPLISAALYLGQFASPVVVMPVAGAAGCSPYAVGVGIAVIYLVQTILTRKHHALPPQ